VCVRERESERERERERERAKGQQRERRQTHGGVYLDVRSVTDIAASCVPHETPYIHRPVGEEYRQDLGKQYKPYPGYDWSCTPAQKQAYCEYCLPPASK
jgi:hypothetical protein